jgi:hypothetical protein
VKLRSQALLHLKISSGPGRLRLIIPSGNLHVFMCMYENRRMHDVCIKPKIRVAAPGEHRGGFGTCGRRARGRTSPYQDPRPNSTGRQPATRWRQALYGLCDPMLPAAARDPQPTPGLHRQVPAGQALHGSSRGPVTQTGPGADNIASQDKSPQANLLVKFLGPSGPATARPRWALVLHALSRGPVTQTESDWPGSG